MDGSPLALGEVVDLLRHPPGKDEALGPGALEALNQLAIRWSPDAVPMPRTPEDVRELHRGMFRGVLEAPGRLRRNAAALRRGTAARGVYVASHPRRIDAELAAALDWLHSANEHPVARALLVCHEVHAIHPFSEGNGRVARALVGQFLWHHGYHGWRYALVDWGFYQRRRAYVAMLDASRGPGWDRAPWLDFAVGVAAGAYAAAVERSRFPGDLPGGLNDRQVKLAAWLARADGDGRRFKFGEIRAAFPDIPRRTLQADLARLVDAGVLGRRGERRGTAYAVRAR